MSSHLTSWRYDCEVTKDEYVSAKKVYEAFGFKNES